MKWFVDCDWLAVNLDNPDVIVFDGSWHMPAEERDPLAEFNQEHIPGAQFFDIDKIADLSTDLPHMLPSEDVFSDAMQKIGANNGQTIVVYDVLGLRSAPRLWWTFRVMGVEKVYILAGGLPKWKADGHPVTNAQTLRPIGDFVAKLSTSNVSDFDAVMASLGDAAIDIVDARSEERWRGLGPEPRPNLPSGRMPGSKNVPFPLLINEDSLLKDVDVMRQIFVDAGVDLDKRIITSCGSGATAAILYLALDTIGVKNLSIYDGSWTEWAAREDALIDTDA